MEEPVLETHWGPCWALTAAAAAAGVLELADLRLVGFGVVEAPVAAEALLVADVGPAAAGVKAIEVDAGEVMMVSEPPVAETAVAVVHVVQPEAIYELQLRLPPAAPDAVAALAQVEDAAAGLAQVEAAAERPLSEPTFPFPAPQEILSAHLGRGILLARHEQPLSHCLPRR